MLTLLDRINEPLGGINFLFDKENSLFLAAVFFCSAIVFFQHIAVTFTNAKLRRIFGIKRQFQFSCIVVDKKIRNNIAFCFVDLTYMTPRLWIELCDLNHYLPQLIIGQIQATLDFFVVFLGELIKVFG